jgi:hypothetical protein
VISPTQSQIQRQRYDQCGDYLEPSMETDSIDALPMTLFGLPVKVICEKCSQKVLGGGRPEFVEKKP